MLKRILTAVGGNPTARDLRLYEQVADEIDRLEPEYQALSDSELRSKTDLFKEKLQSATSGILDAEDKIEIETHTMQEILTHSFATVREAAVRTIGLRHYPVQLVGGQVLHAGRIAEMRTGEGKTLVATLPLYLNALSGRGTHLVTVNDYLARRDAKWMGPIFHMLGMSVGILQDASRTDNAQMAYLFDPTQESPQEENNQVRLVPRNEAYSADITYGTNNEFGFDYLRDNIAHRLEDRRQRELHYSIIDEVDNVLIDSARTPLIISGPAQHDPEMYIELAKVVRRLKPEHYEIDERSRTISVTHEGYDRVEELVGKTLRDPDSPEDITPEQAQIQSHLEQALRAEFIFKRNKDYLVRGGRVVIVDDFTGRVMPGRRWSDGLHQAVEAKEGVAIQAENVTYANITLQNYFRMYTRLSGMSGTAVTEAEEFDKIYQIDVVPVPTHLDFRARVDPKLTEIIYRENGSKFSYIANVTDPDNPLLHRRKDYDDLVFRTEEAKLRALTQEVLARHVSGQPMLIGTTSVESSERLSMRFRSDELKKIALIWLLREAWFETNEREEDGRAVPELADLNLPLDKLNKSHMRSLGKDLKVRLNPTTQENLLCLCDIIGLEDILARDLQSVLETGISCQVLNAKKHDEESRIIARAGSLGAVTIATNMAGRGVDIKLGGEIAEDTIANVNRVLKRSGQPDAFDMTHEERNKTLQLLSNDDYGIYVDEVQDFLKYMEDEQLVRKLGGLHVVGSERHEARRIDNQLRGRASRQGDPGSSRFYLSLEDELMRRFGGANVSSLMEKLNIDEAMPIEHGIVNKSIEQSQTRVEGANFDVRKHLLEYDDVLNVQRTKFYDQRDRIFSKDDLTSDVAEMLASEVHRRVTLSTEDEEGWWRLLAWLDSIQPTIESNDGSLFFSFSIELLLDSLGETIPSLGNLWLAQLELDGTTTNVEDCMTIVAEDRSNIIEALLAMARRAADLALERMLMAYSAEISNLEDHIPTLIREKCELAEMAFEGAEMDAREGGHPIQLGQVAKTMCEMSGASVQFSRSEIDDLSFDTLKDEVSIRIQDRVGTDLLTKFVRRVQKRTGLDIEIEVPVWNKLNWEDWREEVVEILSEAQNARIQSHIGDITSVLEKQLSKPERLVRSDWGRLILEIAYSKDVVFHEKSRQRLVRMEQRFPYVYHAAELLDGELLQSLIDRVLQHLQTATEHLRSAWGQLEIQRLQSEKLSDLKQNTISLVCDELGEEDFNSVKSSEFGSLSGSFRSRVCAALGRSVTVGLYRQILLSISSQLWVDYLTSMEALRTSVGLEAYAQRDPLTAYKSRAFDLFRQLLIDMRSSLVVRMFTSTPVELTGINTEGIADEAQTTHKVLRRNDPCWCGSGKKFKNCHMNKSNGSNNKSQQRGNPAAVQSR